MGCLTQEKKSSSKTIRWIASAILVNWHISTWISEKKNRCQNTAWECFISPGLQGLVSTDRFWDGISLGALWWNFYSDQVDSYLRGWHLSAQWWPNWERVTPETLWEHHCNFSPRDLMDAAPLGRLYTWWLQKLQRDIAWVLPSCGKWFACQDLPK